MHRCDGEDSVPHLIQEAIRNNKLLGTSATLVVTGALLVVTKS